MVGGLLATTGAGWALLHYLWEPLGVDERAAISMSATLLQVHGAAAMASLVLLGSLLAGHVGDGWRASRNKASGVGALALTGVLAVTGYFLYYAGGEDARAAASAVHLGAGLLLPAIVLWHALRLIRARRRHASLSRAVHERRSARAGRPHAATGTGLPGIRVRPAHLRRNHR